MKKHTTKTVFTEMSDDDLDSILGGMNTDADLIREQFGRAYRAFDNLYKTLTCHTASQLSDQSSVNDLNRLGNVRSICFTVYENGITEYTMQKSQILLEIGEMTHRKDAQDIFDTYLSNL